MKISSIDKPLKGPPEAVRNTLEILVLSIFFNAVNNEKCSESIGISSVLLVSHWAIIYLPNTTKDSLFANKSFPPDFAASRVKSKHSNELMADK